MDVTPLRVPWILRGGHVETIVPALWPAPRLAGVHEERIVPVGAKSAVLLRITRPPRKARGTLLVLHGLGGDAEAPYMRRTAAHALERGWVTARMNLRNCGGTERLADTLYNAGQSGDVARVLASLDASGLPHPFACVGFSLGGALCLRHAGEAGADTPLAAFVAVNPPIELEACVRELERPANVLYHKRFVASLCRQIRAVRAVREVPGPAASPLRIATLRRFDGLFTAPDGGFASAEDYYARASAAPLLPGVRRPGLVLSAANDPFVPLSMIARHHASAPPGLAFVHPPHGGHVGYFQRGRPRFWAALVALDFLERAT